MLFLKLAQCLKICGLLLVLQLIKDRHRNLDFLDWFEVIRTNLGVEQLCLIAGYFGILGSAKCDDFSGENPIQWQFRSHQSHMWISI
ncbi:hypothetical protein Peur_015188 [Populus x canadensis]